MSSPKKRVAKLSSKLMQGLKLPKEEVSGENEKPSPICFDYNQK